MSAEIKPEYKHTEVGLIPKDWNIKSLSEIVEFANGKPHEKNIDSSGRYNLITLDSIDIGGQLKNSHKKTNLWDDSLKKGDLVAVLSDLAHGNLLGLCDVITENGKYVLNQRMGRLRRKTEADPFFLKLQINCRQNHFKVRGQGTSQRHIYRRDFDALVIPFPSLSEQHAIASVLGDTDFLINSLDQLITKKRDIQQATMQQLLTGQRRLPGFSGEWEVKKLGDLVARITNGCVYTSDEKTGVPITRIETISDGNINWERVGYAKPCPEIESYKIQYGDILYSHINSIDHIGKVARYSDSK